MLLNIRLIFKTFFNTFSNPGFDFSCAILYAINHTAHTPLAEIATEAPFCCERIVNRLLAKTADDRFATAGDLLEALKACRAELIDAAPRVEAYDTPQEP